ncbi:metal-dependent transcriptional regulator [Candidatus Kaiserbacteria bacterium]|nr:metal-dependent transcriptional regulator [Candidatus Kaiserbacteria bacterium]
MRTSKPTAVKEDYLRAFFRLQEQGVDSVRLVDIAGVLGLSRSTVSERVRELVDQGYVRHAKYGQLSFTRRGHELAKKLTHKHRVIEVFLHDVLKLSKSEAHVEAHRLEHALSDTVIKRLGAFLGDPTTDPHGSPIPAFK